MAGNTKGERSEEKKNREGELREGKGDRKVYGKGMLTRGKPGEGKCERGEPDRGAMERGKDGRGTAVMRREKGELGEGKLC